MVVVVVVASVVDLADSVVEKLPNFGNFGLNPPDSVVADDGSGVAAERGKRESDGESHFDGQFNNFKNIVQPQPLFGCSH